MAVPELLEPDSYCQRRTVGRNTCGVPCQSIDFEEINTSISGRLAMTTDARLSAVT
jgi:hypothetical protein